MMYRMLPYRGPADQAQMGGLARRFPGEHLRVIDLPYRFSSWALDAPENAALWMDASGELVGWAVLQAPFWTIDTACRPDCEKDVYPELLAWADQRARSVSGSPYARPSWYVNVFEDQQDRIRCLERAGFTCQADVGEDSWSKVLLRRPGSNPLKCYPPPAGFVVRPLAGEAEVEAYVALHQSVFESKNMTAAWRRRTLAQPGYDPELDLVVAGPDGRLAAFCVCWLGSTAACALAGQVEPLGCHKDFRRYALGRVALAEGLRRLQERGVETIFVETDEYRNTAFRLYESFGFERLRRVLIYRKDYEPS